ncbi:HK97 family phage prohead protease [Acinetobacter modestus]|uniref:HK97 family phage prohead protease n=1 Tax=Acinetobacter modestus TaxID=1776740 RepID=UPI00301AEBB5
MNLINSTVGICSELLMRNAALKPNVHMRLMPFENAQLRFDQAQDQTKPFEFEGYAVRWDSINTHDEQFVKGAFTDYINAVKAGNARCHMYYNHGHRNEWVSPEYAMRIGKWLNLEEDEIGFKVSGRLTPNLSLANNVRAMLEDETIDGLSIAFFYPDPMDIEDMGKYVKIKRASLYEISVCDEPSDRNARLTDADVRNIETEEDLKRFLNRFNLDDAAALALIQRAQSFGNTKPAIKTDPLSWLDQV